MKTKLLILMGIGLFVCAFSILQGHIDGLNNGTEESVELKSDSDNSNSQAKLSAPISTTQTISKAAIETPEAKNARIMAKARSDYAKVLPLINAVKSGDISNIAHVHMYRNKADYLAFLKSLGLSDDLSEEVFQMLKSEMALSLARPEAIKHADQGAANSAQISQQTSDLKTAVGDENYNRIKYWQSTLQERKRTQEFKLALGNKSARFTEQKEAAVIDALYQARQGNPIYVFNNPHATTQEKMTYVNDVKQRLAPYLDTVEMEMLVKHLTQIAEKPMLPPALLNKIPKLGQ